MEELDKYKLAIVALVVLLGISIVMNTNNHNLLQQERELRGEYEKQVVMLEELKDKSWELIRLTGRQVDSLNAEKIEIIRVAEDKYEALEKKRIKDLDQLKRTLNEKSKEMVDNFNTSTNRDSFINSILLQDFD